MPNQQDLIDKVKSYDPDLDEDKLLKACVFSKESHGIQKRASGAPYYHHPLEVAIILADMKFDVASIITALLHDTVEDTDVTVDEIKKNFGKEIATLVDGVTKLAKIEYQSEYIRQAENFRKLLVAMSEDIRVLIVKLADRLHNMRTLHFVKSPQKRVRIAHETMEIYAPLAERIGMQQMKNELQDYAFAELHPEARDSIISRLDYLRDAGKIIIDSILEELKKKLDENGFKDKYHIIGREKSPCSIWRKMERKNISFEQLSDIMAFRIITNNQEDCYKVLGLVHSSYQMIPGNFKDFISTPKDNGYQSIHTIVMGPEMRLIEIQIRTEKMHQIAEFGVAAHWSYKQKREYSTDGKQYKWVRELLYILEHTPDSEEFLENTKLEISYDQVFAFTPKGELVALPKGATPVDFAYDIHSNIGHHCSGAKINGRIVPLRTKIKNGDQVEIITSKSQLPSPTWEKFVITGKAKSEIRRFIRLQKRKEFIKLGKSIILRELSQQGMKVKRKPFIKALSILGKKKPEDLYASVGEGLISGKDFFKAMYPNKKPKSVIRNPLSLLRFGKERKKNSQIPLKGLVPGMAVYFAECCHPIPGDSIIGVVTTGKGMTIHTSDCHILENFSSTPERLKDVSWGKTNGQEAYIGRIKVILKNSFGSLATLTDEIAKAKANINNLKITGRSQDFFEIVIDISVLGESQLANITRSLNNKKCVHSASRFKK